MPEYLVEGAKLRCLLGSKSKPIRLPKSHNVEIKGQSLISEDDSKRDDNIPSFGTCWKTGSVCFPQPAEKWLNTNNKKKINGKNAVTVDSCLICTCGGLILPEESGQTELYETLFFKLGSEKFAQVMGSINATLNGCSIGGDPVNLCTGNFIYQKTDLNIVGEQPLDFVRSYNSMDGRKSVFGIGWRHNHEIRLVDQKEFIAVIFGDGHTELYSSENKRHYTQITDGKPTLIKNWEDYELKHNDLVYRFDKEGRCLEISDKFQKTVSYEYRENRLHKVSNLCGSIEFVYDADGKIEQVQDHTGRTIYYAYNEDGQLVSVKDTLGNETKYVYDENGVVAEEIDPLGNSKFNNTYDKNGKTIHQEMPNGAKMDFEYKDEELKNIYTEPNGARVRVYYDENFRTVKTADRAGVQYFEYDNAGNRTFYQDRNENQTLFEYDENNNLIRIADPLGNDIHMSYTKTGLVSEIAERNGGVTKREFDSKNRLLSVTDPIGRVTRYTYGHGTQPVSRIYPDGSVAEYEYDSRSNPVKVKKATGGTEIYTYDNLNRMTSQTDANGNVTRYAYDTENRLVGIINAAGDKREYVYDGNGNLVRVLDFDGFEVLQEFDALKQCTAQINKEGHSVNMEYDVMGNMTSYTYPNGGTYKQKYDKRNCLVRLTDSAGANTEYTYDNNGNVTEIKSADGEIIRYEYDVRNLKTLEVLPGNRETRYEYDEMGRMIRMQMPSGDTMTFTYDAAGQRTKIRDSHGRETHFSYDALGQLKEITEPDGKKIVHEHEPGGRLKKITLRDGSTVSFTYDGNGNVVKQESNDGYAVNFQYDCLNRVTAVTDSTGKAKSFTLDTAGNVVLSVDALGNTYRYSYSPNGHLTEVVDPLGNAAYCSYDEMGNLIEAAQYAKEDIANALSEGNDPREKARTIASYERNIFGQAISYTDALGNTEHYRYDLNGRLIGKADREGFQTKFFYDDRGNLTKTQYGDGKQIEREYDSHNRLRKMQDWLGVTEFRYNELGMPVSVTDHNGNNLSYSWDENGLLQSLTYPDGSVVNYSYNVDGKIVKILDGGNAVDYQYDEAGRLTKKAFSNGTYSSYAYNEHSQLQSLTSYNSSGQLDRLRYEYDVMGNKTAVHKDRRGVSEDSGSFFYEYDGMSRLTRVRQDHEIIRQYEYDGFGNRSVLKKADGMVEYTYNEENQLILETLGDTQKEYSYDRRGNLTRVLLNGDSVKSFRYGAQNRLEAAEFENEYHHYGYNGFLQQVSHTKKHRQKSFADTVSPDTHTDFILDPLREHHNLLMRSGEQNGRYVWDFQQDMPVFGSDEDSPLFYLQDEMGSTLRATGRSGYEECTYAYDEFGRDISKGHMQMRSQPFGYTGHDFDEWLGMYHTQARYYDPRIGAWISMDTVRGNIDNLLTLHLYNYCWNNPLRYVDPDGHLPWDSAESFFHDLTNDAEGRDILWNWLYGGGEDQIYNNDKGWNEYMMTNELLTNQTAELVINYSDELKPGETKLFDVNTAMEIENGEQMIGYQYLHGTNETVGGYGLKGVIRKDKDGKITVIFNYQWNDIIDPNFIYDTDSTKAKFAKSIPFANPTDYVIRICWSDVSTLENGQFSSGWLQSSSYGGKN